MIYHWPQIQNLKIKHTKEPRGSTGQNKYQKNSKKKGGGNTLFLGRKSLDLLVQIGLLEEDS